MRTISQASSSLLTTLTVMNRALYERVAAVGKLVLRGRVEVVNSIDDLNPHQMRDLGADIEGESMRNHPAFRAFEKERVLNDAKQKALLFTLGMGGR